MADKQDDQEIKNKNIITLFVEFTRHYWTGVQQKAAHRFDSVISVYRQAE